MKKQLLDLTVRHYIKKLRKDPETQIPKVLSQIDRFAGGRMAPQMNRVHMMLDNPDSNIFQMVVRALNEIDPAFITGLGNSFVINTGFDGWAKQVELREKYQCNIPWAILLDPTSACNLHCTGCWAADYGNQLSLSYDDIDSIIRQGTELGIFFYIYTGGEPLIRKKDIIALCEAHPECVFLCFTNGTLIDQEFCDDLKRVANFVPALSLEGDREATDSRRGEGVYDKVIAAMDLMHANHVPFGISCCYTSENYASVSSDEYIDSLIEHGAFFVWYFHYMPVGSDANVELMVTPEQREGMYHTIRRWRLEKPIFPLDFQNDGQYVQGCIAGGRRYLHINAAGDVDPCVFVHFSDSNIHEKTLLEALQGPLFKAYYDNQPFNGNHLRPCPMLENPDALRRMIAETGAKSSNLEGEETAEMLCSRCDRYAAEWAPTAERLWEINHNCIPFKH